MKIQEYVDSKLHSSFKIGGQFRYFTEVLDKEDLSEASIFAKSKNIPIIAIGEGSNFIFSDKVLEVLAIKIKIKGFEIIPARAGGKEDGNEVLIKVGAGEIFDEIIKKTIDENLAGFETLSAIPGTIGATPIQNVGAYGSEVKDFITSVEVFDLNSNTFTSISNDDCKFGYRDSVFKNEAKRRYVITTVSFKLKKVEDNTSLLQKREEITNTRWSKLPKPNEIPNVGSFFKNPIISNETADKIKIDFPEAKFFPIDENHTKIPAGWLIENAGLKGKSFGKIAVYGKNALVLINNGGATDDDLLKAKDEIVKIVKEKFGITLEQEPEIV